MRGLGGFGGGFGVVFSSVLVGAGLLVGEAEERFEVGEAPPAEAAGERPESVGDPGIEAVRRGSLRSAVESTAPSYSTSGGSSSRTTGANGRAYRGARRSGAGSGHARRHRLGGTPARSASWTESISWRNPGAGPRVRGPLSAREGSAARPWPGACGESPRGEPGVGAIRAAKQRLEAVVGLAPVVTLCGEAVGPVAEYSCDRTSGCVRVPRTRVLV